jgi:acyl carrier protein
MSIPPAKRSENHRIMNQLTEDQIASIHAVLIEKLGVKPAQIRPEARLDADLGADSLDEVEIVMALEEKLGLTWPEDAEFTQKSVAQIYGAVTLAIERQENPAAPASQMAEG